MGCKFCKPSTEEPQMNIEPNNGNQIKQIEENLIEPEKENYNAFLQAFNEKLPNIGKKLSEEAFQSVVPQNYSNEPFVKKPEYSNNINTYKMGPIEFPNGDMYRGSWDSNINFEGEGEYYLKENNVFIHGIWLNGNLTYARIYFINNDIYEGEVKDTTFNGKGKLISSEETYEGDFVNGEKEGIGKLTFSDGVEYEGNFNKGIFKGKGKMDWKNGYLYEGEFKGAVLMGEGVLKGPEGDCYQGHFENNVFSGKGKYTYNNGNIYEGEFKYGLKSGKGKYTVLNRYIFEGNWDNDLPNGNGKLSTFDNSGVLKSTWREGNILEDPIYEYSNENNFEGISLNIIPDKVNINPKGLSHLEINETLDTQYKPEQSLPSFLQD